MLETISFTFACGFGLLTLDVDTPFLGAEVEGLKRTLLAETLCLIDELVSSVVSLARVPFRVLVCSKGELCLVSDRV